jgi:hypothetical protein
MNKRRSWDFEVLSNASDMFLHIMCYSTPQDSTARLGRKRDLTDLLIHSWFQDVQAIFQEKRFNHSSSFFLTSLGGFMLHGCPLDLVYFL